MSISAAYLAKPRLRQVYAQWRLAGDKLLLLFGKEYSAEATTLVRLLTLAALPLSVNLLYLGVARVKKELKNLLLRGRSSPLAHLRLVTPSCRP